jgi:hypothetical protein
LMTALSKENLGLARPGPLLFNLGSIAGI